MNTVQHSFTGFRRGRGRRGAASVLIVLLIVVLIFFGVLALVTAAADQRLAQRRADWNQQYYRADSLAESVYASLDQMIHTDTLADQPEAAVREAMSQWLAASPAVQTYSIDRRDDALILQIRVYQPEQSDQGIELTLQLLTGQNAHRLNILGWQQWQPPIPEDDSAFERWEGAD